MGYTRSKEFELATLAARRVVVVLEEEEEEEVGAL